MDLSDDDVRERFSPYHDRELSEAEHDAVRDALAKRPALAREYQTFCAMLDGLGALGSAGPVRKAEAPAALLEGVQDRLRKRSGGRFYRDRWSRTAGLFPAELLAALLLVALVVAWFAMTAIQVRGPSAPYAPPPEAGTTPAR
jgi:anti-sigma factor RsiW